MIGSDVVTISNFFPNGSATVTDRYVPWVAQPLSLSPSLFPEVDIHQDWTLLLSCKSTSKTVAIIRRAIDTADSQDRIFNKGALPVIFAWGGPGNSGVTHHGSNRGTTSIDFFANTKQQSESTTTTTTGSSTPNVASSLAVGKTNKFSPVDSDGEMSVLFSPKYKYSVWVEDAVSLPGIRSGCGYSACRRCGACL